MKRIDPLTIVSRYYEPGSTSYMILVGHSKAVAEKALDIAGRFAHHTLDMGFIEAAAMLHDIGIFMTNEPGIGCFGDKEYICHGYLGRELLEREGLPIHALICERHVGVGISIDDIDNHKLPIPRREMMPITVEEKIICFADKFFSKRRDSLRREKPIEEVRKSVAKYGSDKLKRFDEMYGLFNI